MKKTLSYKQSSELMQSIKTISSVSFDVKTTIGLAKAQIEIDKVLKEYQLSHESIRKDFLNLDEIVNWQYPTKEGKNMQDFSDSMKELDDTEVEVELPSIKIKIPKDDTKLNANSLLAFIKVFGENAVK